MQLWGGPPADCCALLLGSCIVVHLFVWIASSWRVVSSKSAAASDAAITASTDISAAVDGFALEEMSTMPPMRVEARISVDEATPNTKRTGLRSVAVQPISSTRIHHLCPSLPKHTVLANAGSAAAVATSHSWRPEKPTKKTFLHAPSSVSSSNSVSIVPDASKANSSSPIMNLGWNYRLQALWRLHKWMVFAIGTVLLFGEVAAASRSNSNEASIDNRSDIRSQRELYVVLVSIPVLEKVLPLKHLAEELLHRGYRVGFALPENCRHWVSDLERLEFISLGNIVGKGRSHALELQDLHTKGMYESYETTLRYYTSFQRPMFAALLEDLEDDSPNLVVVDRYTFAGFDVCHALGIPYVVNSPNMLLDMDSPPAYVPAPFSNYSMDTPSVLERCLSNIYRLRFRVVMMQVYKEINQVRQEHGLYPIKNKDQLYGQSLVLVNSVFGLDHARPIAPHFQLVGLLRSRHQRTTSASYASQPSQLSLWLRQSTEPVIFINFEDGTPLSREFVATLMNGLEAVNARLVWKISLHEQAAFDLRSRPRESLYFLGHDSAEDDETMARLRFALLITQGEFYNLQDALVRGAPVLGIPFSAEQLEGVNAVVRAGAGQSLDSETFTATNVKAAVEKLLCIDSFPTSARHVGELIKSGGGTVRAVDHIISVAQFGPSFLLAAKNTQPLYMTLLVDVYLVYGAILCASAVVLRTLFAVLCSIVQPLDMLPLAPDEVDVADPLAK